MFSAADSRVRRREATLFKEEWHHGNRCSLGMESFRERELRRGGEDDPRSADGLQQEDGRRVHPVAQERREREDPL